MRVHISMDDAVVAELDQRVGARERSAFIESAVRRALAERDRDEAFERAVGAIADEGHEWDDDPAEWVRSQRAGAGRSG